VEALYLNAQFDDAIKEGNELLKQKEMPNIYGVIAYAYVGKKNISLSDFGVNQSSVPYFSSLNCL
jgi:hypothetical protein